jgi:hypothetical protein
VFVQESPLAGVTTVRKGEAEAGASTPASLDFIAFMAVGEVVTPVAAVASQPEVRPSVEPYVGNDPGTPPPIAPDTDRKGADLQEVPPFWLTSGAAAGTFGLVEDKGGSVPLRADGAVQPTRSALPYATIEVGSERATSASGWPAAPSPPDRTDDGRLPPSAPASAAAPPTREVTGKVPTPPATGASTEPAMAGNGRTEDRQSSAAPELWPSFRIACQCRRPSPRHGRHVRRNDRRTCPKRCQAQPTLLSARPWRTPPARRTTQVRKLPPPPRRAPLQSTSSQPFPLRRAWHHLQTRRLPDPGPHSR